jgi:hypothetical protein
MRVRGDQMRDDLLAKEVEVDPMRRFAPERASEYVSVESSRRFMIGHGKCKVKSGTFAHAG